MTILTEEIILAGLRAAVQAKGESHVYTPLSEDESPRYFEPEGGWTIADYDSQGQSILEPVGDYEPACLVGHVFDHAGITYEDVSDVNEEPLWELVRTHAVEVDNDTIGWALRVAQEAQDGTLLDLYAERSTPALRGVIERVVGTIPERRAYPWGVAVRLAEEVLEDARAHE